MLTWQVAILVVWSKIEIFGPNTRIEPNGHLHQFPSTRTLLPAGGPTFQSNARFTQRHAIHLCWFASGKLHHFNKIGFSSFCHACLFFCARPSHRPCTQRPTIDHRTVSQKSGTHRSCCTVSARRMNFGDGLASRAASIHWSDWWVELPRAGALCPCRLQAFISVISSEGTKFSFE